MGSSASFDLGSDVVWGHGTWDDAAHSQGGASLHSLTFLEDAVPRAVSPPM